jgi:hypothetical protein
MSTHKANSLKKENEVLRNELLKHITQKELNSIFSKEIIDNHDTHENPIYKSMLTKKGYPCEDLFLADEIEFKRLFGIYMIKPKEWNNFIETLRHINNIIMIVRISDKSRHIRWSSVV